jgi:two-component system, chemotaxis family, response regulator Rcp1
MSSSASTEVVRASQTPCHILVVDPNPADVVLVKEAFREAGLSPEIHIVKNGDEALAFLHRQRHFTNAPRPDFIMLERTLPMMTGMQVLEAMKTDPEFVSIPVVVCSAFQRKDEVEEAYILKANATATKSSDLEAYFAVIRTFHAKWCKENFKGRKPLNAG